MQDRQCQAIKVSAWIFFLALDRCDLYGCVSTMVGWALAKSSYDSGLILLGRRVGLLPNPGCWPLEKRDDCIFLAPEPRGDF